MDDAAAAAAVAVYIKTESFAATVAAAASVDRY